MTQDQDLIVIDMTTPASGQISIGDLKSELSLVGGPSYDVSLYSCNYDVMADGFYDTYGYNRLTATQIPISNFYDLQTECAYELRVQSSVVDYNQFDTTLSNESYAGGTVGPNGQPQQYLNPGTPTNPSFINSIPIVHSEDVSVILTCQNSSGPPFNQQLIIEYSLDSGGSYTAIAGSPFSGPSVNANTGILTNAPNSATSTPRFTLRCTQ